MAAGAVAAVVVAAAVWLLFSSEAPRPVTLEEARQRTEGSTATTPEAGAFGPPAAWVYLYRGEGSEKTSFPPLTEEQGPTMPATVVPDDEGCWRFRIDYNSHHWQDWRYCAEASGIVTWGGTTFARRDFGTFKVDNTSTFTCAGPDVVLWEGMRAGDSRPSKCTGTSTAMDGPSTSAGTLTYVGDEDIDVGGTTVRSRHLRSDRDVTGAQQGAERVDWWVDPRTMLPIRNEHRISVDMRVGGINITYTEVTSYTLTSLTPQ